VTEYDANHLTLAVPPWLLWVSPKAGVTNWAWALQRALPDAIVRVLRGKKMTTVTGLYNESAAALQFPDYFGENWAAFDECLHDLEWLPGKAHVLIVADAHSLLVEAYTEGLATLLEIITSVCEERNAPVEGEWARPAIPFHVVFQMPPDETASVLARFRSAGAELAPIR